MWSQSQIYNESGLPVMHLAYKLPSLSPDIFDYSKQVCIWNIETVPTSTLYFDHEKRNPNVEHITYIYIILSCLLGRGQNIAMAQSCKILTLR